MQAAISDSDKAADLGELSQAAAMPFIDAADTLAPIVTNQTLLIRKG